MLLRSTVVLLLFVVSACASTTVRHSADFKDVIDSKNKGLLIIPPRVKVELRGVGAPAERQYGFEDHVQDLLVKKVQAKLEEKGYRSLPLKRKEVKDKKIYKEIDHVFKGYEVERMKTYGIPNNQIEQAAMIETKISKKAQEAADKMVEKTGHDVFIITEYNETVLTSGARAAAFAKDLAVSVLVGALGGSTAGQSSSKGDLAWFYLGLLDAKKGHILWTNYAYHEAALLGSIGSDEDVTNRKLDHMVKHILYKFPVKDALSDEAQ